MTWINPAYSLEGQEWGRAMDHAIGRLTHRAPWYDRGHLRDGGRFCTDPRCDWCDHEIVEMGQVGATVGKPG